MDYLKEVKVVDLVVSAAMEQEVEEQVLVEL